MSSPLSAAIAPNSSAARAPTVAVPSLEPSIQSKAVGSPPLSASPTTVRRDS
jgi:hypothetical protein